MRLNVDALHAETALRQYQRNCAVRAAYLQYLFAALRAREVGEQYRVHVDAKPLALVGLIYFKRPAEQIVALLHYVQSSSRTPTTCESPCSCNVTP